MHERGMLAGVFSVEKMVHDPKEPNPFLSVDPEIIDDNLRALLTLCLKHSDILNG